eukprot:scaffold19424_cov142-Cylindrotheca_fusiformis.AAC.6
MSQATEPGQRSKGGRQGPRGGGRGRGGRGRGRGGRGFHKKGRGDTASNQGNRNKNDTSTETVPNMKNLSVIGAYKFCSKQECEERQKLKQVHELEATLETCTLPQAQRVLDPCLAVSKYKRSAAGTEHATRPTSTLERTLKHLQYICATRRATPDHPPVQNTEVLAEFVVDRLRACQSDATRLGNSGIDEIWHVQLIRILIWIRYWTYTDESQFQSWMQRTINTMISTAFDAYWATRQENENGNDDFVQLDDEILCWSALFQLCRQQYESPECCCNLILLEFAKFSRKDSSKYPLWRKAMSLASQFTRQEYYTAWKNEDFPILFKCCIEPSMFLWRYRTIQQYNKSFAKQEKVSDLPRLLNIHKMDWSLEYAQAFGLPAEQTETEVTVVLKQVALEDSPPLMKSKQSRRDHKWVFGNQYTDDEFPGLSIACVEQLLQKGRLG